MSTAEGQPDYKPGDVFQINTTHGRPGWIGCFVLATEVRSWGIQGFVAWPAEHGLQSRADIRLPWSEVDFIGAARLVPADAEPPEEPS